MSPTDLGSNYECNVCGSTEFIDFRTRKLARCAQCHTLERSRLLQLILDTEKLVRPGMRVLHLAPEAGIGRNIRKIIGDGYDAVDIRPEIYPADLNIRQFDLTTDVEDLPSKHYDLVIHSHVLEHIPCDMTSVLWHLHRSMTDSGTHVICVPVLPGHYSSDFGPLTIGEKTARFGQFDHVRKFGHDDFDMHLGKVFRLNPYDHSGILTQQMVERHRIGVGSAKQISSNTFFLQNKASLRLQ